MPCQDAEWCCSEGRQGMPARESPLQHGACITTALSTASSKACFAPRPRCLPLLRVLEGYMTLLQPI